MEQYETLPVVVVSLFGPFERHIAASVPFGSTLPGRKRPGSISSWRSGIETFAHAPMHFLAWIQVSGAVSQIRTSRVC